MKIEKARYTDEELIHILETTITKDKWTLEAFHEAADRIKELSPNYIKSPITNNYYRK